MQLNVRRPCPQIGAVAPYTLAEACCYGGTYNALYGVSMGLHRRDGTPTGGEVHGRSFAVRTGDQNVAIGRILQGIDHDVVRRQSPIFRLAVLGEYFDPPALPHLVAIELDTFRNNTVDFLPHHDFRERDLGLVAEGRNRFIADFEQRATRNRVFVVLDFVLYVQLVFVLK